MEITGGFDSQSLIARQDVQLALDTAELVQTSIRHADTKITAVSSVACGGAVFLADRLGEVHRIGSHGLTYLSIGLILAATAVIGLTGAAWQLGDGLKPRLGSPQTTGALGIPALAAGHGPPGPTPRAADDNVRWQAQECWLLTRGLARIAQDKHVRVRRGVCWIAIALLGTLGWELMTALASTSTHGVSF